MRTPYVIRQRNDPLEKDIERKICVYARRHDIGCYKYTSPARASVPDRLLDNPNGWHGFMEVKRRGAKPTVKQWREINLLRARNHFVAVVDNVEDGKRLIDAIVGLHPGQSPAFSPPDP